MMQVSQVTIPLETPNVEFLVRVISDRFCKVGCSPDVAGMVALNLVHRELVMQFAISAIDMRMEMIVTEANTILDKMGEALDDTESIHEASKRRLRWLLYGVWVMMGASLLNMLHALYLLL